MAEIYQLDFFKDPEICRVEASIERNLESQHKIRKKLFAEANKHKKRINELEERLSLLERNICTGIYQV